MGAPNDILFFLLSMFLAVRTQMRLSTPFIQHLGSVQWKPIDIGLCLCLRRLEVSMIRECGLMGIAIVSLAQCRRESSASSLDTDTQSQPPSSNPSTPNMENAC